MLLRPLFLILVLSKLAFFAWSQGYLRLLGFAPARQSEPHRVTQQLRPQALRVLREGAPNLPAAAPAEAAPSLAAPVPASQ